ncbi:hypothetical protein CAPTEDRAFT_180403 [Capitella teleta]|uniref:Sulfotransferase domain-containing protein n=1 Tax=Capitella teleta TaxID=283909 RepID=R7U921_CAPTE|nr:hypothetical protein CAPTEDRAFT_180403 [Capitella teleta]|eukprot:ELU02855.1 hypothetical protein CAPTEDRAFT_180403 [Capitella teleta]
MVEKEYLDILKTWTADQNDVILAAYPKTGGTWISTIIDYVFHDGDIEKADAKGDIHNRVPFLENVYPEGKPPTGAQKLDKMKPPRFAKVHLGYNPVRKQVEEDKAKFIVVFRNPKDTIVSYYHYYRANKSMGFFQGDFHEFFELFREKRLRYGDIIEWFEGWWRNVGRLNVLPIRYEEIKVDLEKHVRSIAEFCGKDFSDDVIQRITTACTLKEMKKNPATNLSQLGGGLFDNNISNFIRKGEVGDWKNWMTQEESDYIDERCKNLAAMGFPV